MFAGYLSDLTEYKVSLAFVNDNFKILSIFLCMRTIRFISFHIRLSYNIMLYHKVTL